MRLSTAFKKKAITAVNRYYRRSMAGAMLLGFALPIAGLVHDETAASDRRAGGDAQYAHFEEELHRLAALGQKMRAPGKEETALRGEFIVRAEKMAMDMALSSGISEQDFESLRRRFGDIPGVPDDDVMDKMSGSRMTEEEWKDVNHAFGLSAHLALQNIATGTNRLHDCQGEVVGKMPKEAPAARAAAISSCTHEDRQQKGMLCFGLSFVLALGAMLAGFRIKDKTDKWKRDFYEEDERKKREEEDRLRKEEQAKRQVEERQRREREEQERKAAEDHIRQGFPLTHDLEVHPLRMRRAPKPPAG